MTRKVNPILLAGLGGAVALYAFSQRKAIMLFGSRIVDAAQDTIFRLQLPSYARDYSGIMLRVSREESVDPFLIFGIGDRESGWGTAAGLDQFGPAGRGDYGHGHGFMQIDDRDADNAAFLASGAWTDPYLNVQFGVRKLKRKLAFFQSRGTVSGLTDGSNVYLSQTQANKRGVDPGNYPDPRPLEGAELWQAAISAYNTGEGNVLRNLAAGLSPEFTTAGSDYLTDVSERAANI